MNLTVTVTATENCSPLDPKTASRTASSSTIFPEFKDFREPQKHELMKKKKGRIKFWSNQTDPTPPPPQKLNPSPISDLRRGHGSRVRDLQIPYPDPEIPYPYRLECPASTKIKPVIPTSEPETVLNIQYYSRDGRRNRPLIQRIVVRKADAEKMMKEETFDVATFPRVYLAKAVEEDMDTHGGGYQK